MNSETIRESLHTVLVFSFVACPLVWFIITYVVPYISDTYRIQRERKRALEEVIEKQEERKRKGPDLFSEIDINSIELPPKREKNKVDKKVAKLVSPPNFVLSPPLPVVAPSPAATSKPVVVADMIPPTAAVRQQQAPSFRLPAPTIPQANPWASLPAAPAAARITAATAPAATAPAATAPAPAAAVAAATATAGFSSSRAAAVAATAVLEEERLIKQMQDDQYASSLAKDQAILKAKEEVSKKVIEKQQMRFRVPAEPPTGASEEVITISFRFQSCSPPVRVDRRFYASDSVDAVLDFVESHDVIENNANVEVGTVNPQVLLTRQKQKQNEEGAETVTIKDLCKSTAVVMFVRLC